MAAVAAAALAPALMMSLILYKVDREELAVAAEAEELTNLVQRLPTAAILLAAAEVQVADPLMVPMPRVELILEISVEDLGELAPIPTDRALAAEAEVEAAASEALSLWIAI